jgi:hypothetical protein
MGRRKPPIGLKTNEGRKIQVEKEMLAANQDGMRTPQLHCRLAIPVLHVALSLG